MNADQQTVNCQLSTTNMFPIWYALVLYWYGNSNPTQYALERQVVRPRDALLCISEAMFTRSLVKVPTGPVQPGCSTRLVSLAEVAADPPALQLPLALTQRARGRAAIVAACGC